MDDAFDRVEARLDRLERCLSEIDARVRVVELASGSDAPAALLAQAARDGEPDRQAGGAFTTELAGVLALVGRALVVFAGAYLLRAITESHLVPASVGTAVGLAYAMCWLGAAAWSSEPRHRLSSEFHGGAAVLIALPLLWESTIRFQLLSPPAAAAALGVVTAIALVVAWHRHLEALAWIVTLAAILVAVLLLARTGEAPAFSTYLVLLGLATLWLGYDRDWYGLRWAAALAADVSVLGLTMRALTPSTGERASTAIGVQLLLVGSYLSLVSVRTLVRRRSVIPFEVVQTAAALGVGLGGALAITRGTGTGALALGLSTTLFAAGCYGVALLDRPLSRAANFYFYSTLALAMTLAGTGIVLPQSGAVITWLTLAVVAAWARPSRGRVVFVFHAATYAVAAAALGGAIDLAYRALFAFDGEGWPVVTPLSAVVAVTVGLLSLAPLPGDDDRAARVARAPRLVLAALFVFLASGALVAGLAPLVAAQSGHVVDRGILAALRTAVLAGAAPLLALAGRRDRLREMGWLLYPLLVVTGVKLLVDDFSRSAPSMLFVALAAYGGALIAAPRLARRAVPLSSGEKAIKA